MRISIIATPTRRLGSITNVADGIGHLSISQDQGSTHFGAKHNQWNVRLSNDVPLELKIEMGAGPRPTAPSRHARHTV